MLKLLTESSLILGIVIIILLLFYRKRSQNNSNLNLGISIFCIWYLLFINHLNLTREMLNYPFFARTGNIAGFLAVPFLYWYSRKSFYPGIKWRKYDLLFFIPALIYIIDLTPFFLSDNAYKAAVMKANLEDPSRLIRVEEGWFPFAGFHYVFMYFWNVALMILQIRLIFRNKHISSEGDNSFNQKLFWFITTLTIFHVPLIFPGIFGVIFHLKWYSLSYLSFILSAELITTALFILFSPAILYGFFPQMIIRENHFTPDVKEKDLETETAIIPKLFLSKEDLQQTIEKIEAYMDQHKPYLNKHYTIHNLGQDVEIPVYLLSPIINQHYKSNFNAWINRYRVSYFIELCRNEKRNELTLAGIAEESGFNNRSTFITAFKKETGTTPGIYLKQLDVQTMG